MTRANKGISSLPSDIHELYTQSGGDVWRVEGYFDCPSVTIRNLETGERMTGGIGCLNFQHFQRLLPASEIVE